MNQQKSAKELRKFGFIMFGFFAIIAGVLFWKHQSTWQYLGVFSALFLLIGIFFPYLLNPIEKGWIAFGEKVSTIVSIIVLFFTFYLAITPMALIMRLIGKDPLNKKIDKNSPSYWLPSDSKGTGSRYYTPY